MKTLQRRASLCCCCCLLLLCACSEGPTERRTCNAEVPCPAGQRCEGGVCVAPTGNGDKKADGETCGEPEECQGGLCVGEGATTCATACDEPGACAEGSSCVPVPGAAAARAAASAGAPAAPALSLVFGCQAGEAGARFLGEGCETDADCVDRICEEGLCTRACAGEVCPANWSCEDKAIERGGLTVSHGLCQRLPPLRVVELGAQDAPAQGGEPLAFEVGADEHGFVVVAEGPENLVVSIERLEGPDGTALVDMTKPKETLIRSGIYHGSAAVAVPGSDKPAAAIKPGTYKVWAQTYEARYDKLVPVAGKLDRVAVVFRRWGRRGGLIDLNLHFAPGTGITAATAPNDAVVKEGLGELDRLFRSLLGVAVGEVEYHDLLAADDVVSDGDHVRLIRKQGSKAGPRGLSVGLFVVRKLSLAKGLAGGIPGAPGVYGRPASGVVLERDPVPARMGKLLAHELGHFLGLWHTTETQKSEIASQDTLEDTPACPTGAKIEECPDFNHLMFPYYLNAPGPLKLSVGQASVVRPSPWVYQTSYPDACGAGIPVVDLSRGFASGDTGIDGETGKAASDLREGSCGGSGQPEVAHLLRLPFGAKEIQFDVRADRFTPAVYVLEGSCAGAAKEVACSLGEGETKKLASAVVKEPAGGDYFVVVDGADGAGDYTLTVTVTK